MEIVNIEGLPDTSLLEQLLTVHDRIFKDAEMLVNKIRNKPKVIFTIGLEEGNIVGYKIGYELKKDTFYSWLGGVDKNHRNKGIASSLMKEQHLYVKEKGYKTIQTKTKNKWRHMLILNIKNGFDVIGTYTDDEGETKIILKKSL